MPITNAGATGADGWHRASGLTETEGQPLQMAGQPVPIINAGATGADGWHRASGLTETEGQPLQMPGQPVPITNAGATGADRRIALNFLFARHTVQVTHHKRRQHEGQVDNHIPHQLVIRDILRIHKHPQQVNG